MSEFYVNERKVSERPGPHVNLVMTETVDSSSSQQSQVRNSDIKKSARPVIAISITAFEPSNFENIETISNDGRCRGS